MCANQETPVGWDGNWALTRSKAAFPCISESCTLVHDTEASFKSLSLFCSSPGAWSPTSSSLIIHSSVALLSGPIQLLCSVLCHPIWFSEDYRSTAAFDVGLPCGLCCVFSLPYSEQQNMTWKNLLCFVCIHLHVSETKSSCIPGSFAMFLLALLLLLLTRRQPWLVQSSMAMDAQDPTELTLWVFLRATTLGSQFIWELTPVIRVK